MRPLYDARLEDLGPGDVVKVECLACDHVEMLTASMLRTAGVAEYQRIKELSRRLRCRECDERGRVHITIEWKS
jgi:hypothetical protein